MRIPINISGRMFLWWFGAIFVVVGLGLLYGGIRDATRERTYRTHGQAIEAVVVDKSIQRASRNGNSSTKYQIAYRFTTPDGRTAEGVAAVTVEDWEGLAPGNSFPVMYLPESLETNRAQGPDNMAAAVGLMAVGGLLAVIGGGVLAAVGTRVWRERRLLREGLTAQATVLAVEPSSVSINRVRQWNVRYKYNDHLGRPQEGKSGPVSPATVADMAVGNSLEVRFNRERPEQSVWVVTAGSAGGATGPARGGRPSFWRAVRNFAATAGVLVVALVLGEAVPGSQALDRLAARHELVLTAIMVGLTVIGFALFMGGVLYRIFGSDGQAITHDEVEDVSRGVGLDARPVAARVSAYRFRGASAGASFSDEFTLKEAKRAWQQRAWRRSPRWRANFIVTIGALSFTVGLFGFFVIGAPAGIKLLYLAVIAFAVVGTMVRWARA